MPDGAHDVLERILAADVDDAVFRAMASRERRFTLYYLLDHEEATLDRLADVLAGWLAATERDVSTRVDRESLRISLYHAHLPHLESAGLLSFDPATEVVRAAMSSSARDLIEAAFLTEHATGRPTDP